MAQQAEEATAPAEAVQNEEIVPLKFQEEKINSYKNAAEFDYSEAEQNENWWTKFKRYIALQWQRFLNWLFGDYEAPFLLALFIDVLPYLLLGLLLALVLYLFAKLNPAASAFGTNQQGELIFDEEERIIKTRDIRKLIEKAVANRNYRLAVRYHFLYVLQQLSRKNLVNYDSSKTDEDYLKEIQKADLRQQFQKLNRIYDFTWYGSFSPTEENYQKISRQFHKMEFLIAPQHEQNL